MEEQLQYSLARHRKYILYLLAIFVFCWGIMPYKAIFGGLILGTAFSFFNHWLMLKRMQRFNTALDSGKKVQSLGTMSRMASAGVAAIIALRYPEHFNIVSTVLGLMASYIVIMIDFFIHFFIQRKSGEER
ncbi:ATP synthase subunit I [Bacillus thermotolerans]|uniref:ATP synthase protein I n=1 Tax=Bacillus thermotolerans TaxID=1221996 RepID=A0A0F5HTB5_BACTR|nr:ATP synthase subunit I [Bacillus thermotolerans]KKB36526.1 ATP synthase protein I [Bacillus thermotolerans]KKB41007.1 ATP synthase protein I [Bacillus thermotolerans]KKB44928.1 ATP synthase protein I [Bacillus thermotolerans]